MGGPSEVDSYCAADIGLTQADTLAITAGWAANLAASHAAVNAAGGFNWNQFLQISTPPNNTAACTSFFHSACEGAYQPLPILHTFSEGPGRVFDPLPFFENDLAAFLLLRGDCAFLGYAWNGCSRDDWPLGGRNNQSFSFPALLNEEVGYPVDRTCKEVGTNSGVFERAWSRANARFDCNSWRGAVEIFSK